MSILSRRRAAVSSTPAAHGYIAFLIEFEVHPQMLLRVLEPFARIGLTPEQVLFRVEGARSVVLRVAGAEREVVHKLSHNAGGDCRGDGGVGFVAAGVTGGGLITQLVIRGPRPTDLLAINDTGTRITAAPVHAWLCWWCPTLQTRSSTRDT